MDIQFAVATARSTLVRLGKSFVRLLLACLLVIIGALTLTVLFPSPGVVPGQPSEISTLGGAILLVAFGFSGLSIGMLTRSRNPERRTWVGIHTGIMVTGVVALFAVPRWSALIVATLLVLLVFTPNVLTHLAARRACADHARAAAFYAGLILLFHPSRLARFQSALLHASALRSTERQIAAYRSLAADATPEQFAFLNCCIAVARDDWEGVLGQIRSASEPSINLKRLEIRALGELGRVEEMAMTYAWSESDLSVSDRIFCRLYLRAFSGHCDAVRSLVDGQLRSLSPARKAYWIFIAGQAAGISDEDARRTLTSYADATDDETFRRAARRHLADFVLVRNPE